MHYLVTFSLGGSIDWTVLCPELLEITSVSFSYVSLEKVITRRRSLLQSFPCCRCQGLLCEPRQSGTEYGAQSHPVISILNSRAESKRRVYSKASISGADRNLKLTRERRSKRSGQKIPSTKSLLYVSLA